MKKKENYCLNLKENLWQMSLCNNSNMKLPCESHRLNKSGVLFCQVEMGCKERTRVYILTKSKTTKIIVFKGKYIYLDIRISASCTFETALTRSRRRRFRIPNRKFILFNFFFYFLQYSPSAYTLTLSTTTLK